MSETKKGIVGILLLIFLFFLLLFVFAVYALKTITGSSKEGLPPEKGDAIAVVEIKGVIMDSKSAVEDLLEVEKNKNVKAIILRINSPGGAVGPTQEIYDEVVRIDKVKPVYASFGMIAASGGYYIGAGARKIYATAGTLTGSIGVIMQFIDLSQLYEFIKIAPETIKAGKYKDIGSPSRKMSEEERALMGGMLSEVHGQFMRDIVKIRGPKIKGDIKEHAQGQIFSGEGALKVGLVDQLASLWQAGREIHKEQNLKGEFSLYFVQKKKKFSFFDLVDQFEESAESLAKRYLSLNMRNIPMLLYPY